jgi:hypothetical protein
MLRFAASRNDSRGLHGLKRYFARVWRALSGYDKSLFLLFALSLAFLHPEVNGDGVGYYANLRSPLIDHNFQFASDFTNPKFQLFLIFLEDHFVQNPMTKTGHLPNFYSVGPAMLWLPFVAATHGVVLALNRMGWSIPAEGHSRPYVYVVALSSALYCFWGLWISFRLARKYVEERWAFWATVTIWLATSLPVFLYLFPSWSHGHSVFVTALFLWYWDRTRGTRSVKQWFVFGLITGLMAAVYFGNCVFVLAPVIEVLGEWWWAARRGEFAQKLAAWARDYAAYAAGGVLTLVPTFVAREVVYGSPFVVGVYSQVAWRWKAPKFGAVLFDPTHGLIVCTPVVLLCLVGLYFLVRRVPELGRACVAVFTAFYVMIALYPWWSGQFGFGIRFFISLTPIFILGLGALFERVTALWGDSRRAALRVVPAMMLLIVWNLGLVYQFSVDMFPWFGRAYWDEITYNQFREVPARALHDLRERFSFHSRGEN